MLLKNIRKYGGTMHRHCLRLNLRRRVTRYSKNNFRVLDMAKPPEFVCFMNVLTILLILKGVEIVYFNNSKLWFAHPQMNVWFAS